MSVFPQLTPTLIASRAERAVRKHGIGGVTRLALDHVKPRARSAADYVWFRVDLARRDRPQLSLPDGFELRQGTLDDLELLLQMPRDAEVTTMTEQIVHRRLATDGTPWVVVHDGQLVFSCWTFDRELPVSGERTRVALPDGVCGLEDSMVLPEFRGRGIASAAWALIAERHERAGRGAVVVKVDVRNAASRRVAEKAGFVPCAQMRIVWRDWRTIVRVALPDGDARCAWLRRLERR